MMKAGARVMLCRYENVSFEMTGSINEEGAMSQRMQKASRSWRRQGSRFSPEGSGGTSAVYTSMLAQ